MSGKSSFTRARHLRVHWDDEPDHELHGAVIRMKRLSIRDLEELSRMDLPEGDDDDAVDSSTMMRIIDRLIDGLVSWNLVDDDGEDRPATREELESDATLALAILEKWMDVAGSVSGPLERRSSSGSPSRAVSALTALPSESL